MESLNKGDRGDYRGYLLIGVCIVGGGTVAG